jgi:hypothetical protein
MLKAAFSKSDTYSQKRTKKGELKAEMGVFKGREKKELFKSGHLFAKMDENGAFTSGF